MRKKSAFCVAGCLWIAMVAATVRAGDGNEANRVNKGNRDQLKAKILERFDANGNGQLDPEEKQAARAAREKRRSGKGKGGKGKGGARRKEMILKRFDANGNGQIDPEEKRAARAAMKKLRRKRGVRKVDTPARRSSEETAPAQARRSKGPDIIRTLSACV